MMKIRLLERRLHENANYMQTESYSSTELHMLSYQQLEINLSFLLQWALI